MVNYQNGKIYTIRNRIDETLIYVGSTSQTLSQRMTQHRSDCKKRRHCRCSLYDYIIDNDWSNFYIELYEMYPCNQKCELEKREGEIIRQIATINIKINGRTKKEWYEDNPEYFKKYRENNAEKLKENKKIYYENNAEYFKEYHKKYRQDNIDKEKENKKIYYENNAEKIKERSKEWRENNADKVKERSKKYYKDNYDKLREKNKEKVCCDICGAFSLKHNLSRHQKSKKCTDIASKK
jgi:hypothetical protein